MGTVALFLGNGRVDAANIVAIILPGFRAGKISCDDIAASTLPLPKEEERRTHAAGIWPLIAIVYLFMICE